MRYCHLLMWQLSMEVGSVTCVPGCTIARSFMIIGSTATEQSGRAAEKGYLELPGPFC